MIYNISNNQSINRLYLYVFKCFYVPKYSHTQYIYSKSQKSDMQQYLKASLHSSAVMKRITCLALFGVQKKLDEKKSSTHSRKTTLGNFFISIYTSTVYNISEASVLYTSTPSVHTERASLLHI